MHTSSRIALLAAIVAALLVAPRACGAAQDKLPAGSGGMQREGAFVVRYNALPASALPATAAQRYGLAHSARQGLLNISVGRTEGATETAVPAEVRGHASTGSGTPVPVRFRTIDEGGGVSYLGTFRVPSSDTLRFDIDVTPQGGATQHVHFEQAFLVD